MSQTEFLFLGGPLDQQWRHVPRLNAVTIAVENMDGPITSRMVNYYRRTILAPGWLIAFDTFTTEPTGAIEPGTPMPGWVEGETPRVGFIPLAGEWPYDWRESLRDLHDAIKRMKFQVPPACLACPLDCRSCSHDESNCECYDHQDCHPDTWRNA